MLSYTSCFGCPSQGETGNRCAIDLWQVRCCPRNGKRAKRQIHCAVHGKEMLIRLDSFKSRPSQARRPARKNQITNPRWAGAVQNPACPARGVFMRSYHPATRKGRAMSIISSTSHTASRSATLSQRLTAAVGASILGACLVYFAGFSHIEAVHNAAHDTRHSAAFPCH